MIASLLCVGSLPNDVFACRGVADQRQPLVAGEVHLEERRTVLRTHLEAAVRPCRHRRSRNRSARGHRPSARASPVRRRSRTACLPSSRRACPRPSPAARSPGRPRRPRRRCRAACCAGSRACPTSRSSAPAPGSVATRGGGGGMSRNRSSGRPSISSGGAAVIVASPRRSGCARPSPCIRGPAGSSLMPAGSRRCACRARAIGPSAISPTRFGSPGGRHRQPSTKNVALTPGSSSLSMTPSAGTSGCGCRRTAAAASPLRRRRRGCPSATDR